jgi:hypothetical protein
MNKKRLWKDLDLFPSLGDGAATPPAKEEKSAPAPDTDLGDIFGLGEETPAEETPAPEEKSTDKKTEDTSSTEELPTEETPAEEKSEKSAETPSSPSDTKDEEDEMERLVREAGLGIEELKQSPDLSEKDMKKVVELEEKNSILAGTVESLTRQLDVAREQNNRSIETSEEMRIYQPLIAKLEKEPQLLLFAKYYWSKNEAMKNRLTDICKDMLQNLTGIDVYALLDKETTDSATAFGNTTEDATPPAIDKAEANKTDAAPRRKKDNTFSL